MNYRKIAIKYSGPAPTGKNSDDIYVGIDIQSGGRGDVLAFIELFIDEFPGTRKPLAWLYQDIISMKEKYNFSVKRYLTPLSLVATTQ